MSLYSQNRYSMQLLPPVGEENDRNSIKSLIIIYQNNHLEFRIMMKYVY